MLIPTAGMLALLGAGLLANEGTLLMLEHVGMLPCMLVAMLLHRDEYSASVITSMQRCAINPADAVPAPVRG